MTGQDSPKRAFSWSTTLQNQRVRGTRLPKTSVFEGQDSKKRNASRKNLSKLRVIQTAPKHDTGSHAPRFGLVGLHLILLLTYRLRDTTVQNRYFRGTRLSKARVFEEHDSPKEAFSRDKIRERACFRTRPWSRRSSSCPSSADAQPVRPNHPRVCSPKNM